MNLQQTLTEHHAEIQHIKEHIDTIKADYIRAANTKLKPHGVTVTDIRFIHYLTSDLPTPITHAIEVVISHEGNEFSFYNLYRNNMTTMMWCLQDTFNVIAAENGYFSIQTHHTFSDLTEFEHGIALMLQAKYGENAEVMFHLLQTVSDDLQNVPLYRNAYMLNLYLLSNIADTLHTVIPDELKPNINIDSGSTSIIQLPNIQKSSGLPVDNHHLYTYCNS